MIWGVPLFSETSICASTIINKTGSKSSGGGPSFLSIASKTSLFLHSFSPKKSKKHLTWTHSEVFRKNFWHFVVPKFWTKPYHPEIQKLAPENRPFACPKRKPDRLPFPSFFRGKLAVKFQGCSSFIPGYWGGHYPGILRIHRIPTRHGAVEQRSCNAFSPRPPGGGGCGFSMVF